MATIRHAAHYRECPCTLHGKVYLSDGTSSPELLSLPEALIFYSLGIERGLLKQEEEASLLKQIMESGLPRTQTPAAHDLAYRLIWLFHDHWELPLDLPRPESVFLNQGKSFH